MAFILPAEPSDLGKAHRTNKGLPQQRLLAGSWGCVSHLLKGVVPEYTDRLASLLSLQQGKLHQDRPLQRAGERGPLAVYHSTHHWGVDDGPVRQSVAEREDHRDKRDHFTFHENLSPDTMRTRSNEQPRHRPGLGCTVGILRVQGDLSPPRERDFRNKGASVSLQDVRGRHIVGTLSRESVIRAWNPVTHLNM